MIGINITAPQFTDEEIGSGKLTCVPDIVQLVNAEADGTQVSSSKSHIFLGLH